METNVKPTGSYVLIQADAEETTTAGGIYLPEKRAQDQKLIEGKVLALGPAVGLLPGSEGESSGVGSRVLFSLSYDVHPLAKYGERLYLVPEQDVVAVL